MLPRYRPGLLPWGTLQRARRNLEYFHVQCLLYVGTGSKHEFAVSVFRRDQHTGKEAQYVHMYLGTYRHLFTSWGVRILPRILRIEALANILPGGLPCTNLYKYLPCCSSQSRFATGQCRSIFLKTLVSPTHDFLAKRRQVSFLTTSAPT